MTQQHFSDTAGSGKIHPSHLMLIFSLPPLLVKNQQKYRTL